MKAMKITVLACLLCVVVTLSVADDKSNKKADTKGGGDKGTTALSEVQWQTWGPTECVPLHPGSLPSYRGKSAKFTYALHKLSDDAPKELRDIQPYYVVPKEDNPIILYAGQELIVQITYDLPAPVKGNSPEEALKAARKVADKEVPLIAVSIGSSQGTAFNPAPLRPVQGVSTFSLEGSKKTELKTVYACAYKKPLVGATIPTVTVTALVNGAKDPLQLVQTSLPQVHTLSYFNIATGIAASTIRDSSFNRVQVASGPAQFQTVGTGNPKIFPVLVFTAYVFRPLDAEVPFEWSDAVPQPSVGFSLTSPSTDFLFGFSSEFFRRNVQLAYGFHYGQITQLAPGQINDPTSKDLQQTRKLFTNGAFVGLTFNIDFIKGLFAGGKGQ